MKLQERKELFQQVSQFNEFPCLLGVIYTFSDISNAHKFLFTPSFYIFPKNL